MNNPKIPDVVNITVTGPVGVGKSTVMLELKSMLEERFGATVILNDALRLEDSLANEKWMQRAIGRAVWILSE